MRANTQDPSSLCGLSSFVGIDDLRTDPTCRPFGFLSDVPWVVRLVLVHGAVVPEHHVWPIFLQPGDWLSVDLGFSSRRSVTE